MSEIADAAGVSKSLLFHYFRSKQELYLLLWEYFKQIESDFTHMLTFWKSIYLRREV